MCDYSLESVRSRKAEVGDRLISTAFSGTPTRGFANSRDIDCAVCLQAGTEIAFESPVSVESWGGIFASKKVNELTAVFRKIDTDRPHVHHDALEFPSGKIVLVSRLSPGQPARVVQLPATGRVSAPETREVVNSTAWTGRNVPVEHRPTRLPVVTIDGDTAIISSRAVAPAAVTNDNGTANVDRVLEPVA